MSDEFTSLIEKEQLRDGYLVLTKDTLEQQGTPDSFESQASYEIF